MIKYLIYIFSVSIFLSSCGGKENKQAEKNTAPTVSNNGQTISFPDTESIAFFKTEKVNSNNITAEITAPAKIAATILTSGEGASQNIVLFENPELASSYTQLIQQQINISQIQNVNIKQKQIELERTKDLHLHGAATGQDLLNAQTALSIEQNNLANGKAALIEHEAKLLSAGFNPNILRKSKAGTAYLICDIPENQISKIKVGNTCDILFSAFPEEKFTGKIDGVADIVDNATRMVKLRISINNSSSKLKAGMFANVSFGVSEGNFISISKNSLVTVQGKNYVFIKINNNTFERKEIQAGQQIGDRIIVFSGLNNNDEIAVEGVMQLKGLSFGY
jgi:multidrug efflux pump subunit AcrA (membrane-fusion protein)